MRTASSTASSLLFLPILSALLTGCGGSGSDAPGPRYEAEIQRTSYGIPHIRAHDEAGLGYGVAYAYAQDNLCPLAEHFITLRGDRSRHFGPEGVAEDSNLNNLDSDFFYRYHNDEAALQSAWKAQSKEVQALLNGFVAGFNRYIADTGPGKLPQACRDAAWLPKVDQLDMMRLTRFYGGYVGMDIFKSLVVAARPPSASGSARPSASPAPAAGKPMPGLEMLRAAHEAGSNAVALGRDATDNQRGLLLGNPHLRWSGPLRWYQLHVTIPGKIDAMGSTFPGLPLVAVGFTRQFAWSHTVSSAAHSSLYRLQLDPTDPTRYMVDGRSKPMEKRTISVDVRESDGRLVKRTHDFYRTEFGVVLAEPTMLPWSGSQAYAFRDVNDTNDRMIQQWYAMNRADSLEALRAAVLKVVGNPWNNTIATDAQGDTLFMGVLPIPNVTASQISRCTVPGFENLQSILGTLALKGDTAACQWNTDPAAPQAGIFAGADLPVLSRTDYVQNSNDSAWLSNPAVPLTRFSPAISQEGAPLSMRTRMGISQLDARLSGSDGLPGKKMSAEQLRTLVLSNRAHLADLVMDDVLSLCPGGAHAGTTASVGLTEACAALAEWNRKADVDAGVGYGYFEELTRSLDVMPQPWRIPFDPADPVHTPRGLRVEDPVVAEALRGAMAKAVDTVGARGWKHGMTWGQVQFATRGARKIPIHGGDERLGIYNVIDSDPAAGTHREVLSGTSYLQVVGFEASGPVAQAVLSYSLSSDPASPHFSDQTELFSRKKWVSLPFTEAQVRADARSGVLKVSE